MRNIKLTLSYDGAGFSGWQSQSQGERTVQDVLAAAIIGLTGDASTPTGAGRTDSGVHAIMQVAAFRTEAAYDTDTIVRALNARLPADVRVLMAEDASDGFHPVRDALGKRYRYVIANTPVQSPFARPYSWHVPKPLDIESMRLAAERLVGRYDFRAFMGAGSSVTDTTRALTSLKVGSHEAISFMDMRLAAAEGGCYITIDARGEGFLKQMVRNIAGTLVEAGAGRLSHSDMPRVLASLDRNEAGPTAPAHGLFLVEVLYQDPEGSIDAAMRRLGHDGQRKG